MTSSKTQWCIDRHAETNHMYDTYLPYEFHLRMAAHVADRFKHLLNDRLNYYTSEETLMADGFVSLRNACLLAVWGHDLIEDARCSYNDVKSVLGQEAADIVYAVTYNKGRSRKERASSRYYDEIRATPGAVFVKLCDRIANVQYSTMTGSRQRSMYEAENPEFMSQLGRRTDHSHLEPMFAHLESLFTEK